MVILFIWLFYYIFLCLLYIELYILKDSYYNDRKMIYMYYVVSLKEYEIGIYVV